MQISLEFYTQFFRWATLKGVKIAVEDPPALSRFLLDLENVGVALVAPWATMPKGSGLKLFGQIVAWIAANPDPLKDARQKIVGMQTKWESA